MADAITKIEVSEELSYTEWNFMGKKTMPCLWHNCVQVKQSEYADLGITVSKNPDADNPLDIDATQTVFRINGWTKPPHKIEVGDTVTGIMYMLGTSTVIHVEYSDHPGHFGSQKYIPGDPYIKKTPLVDENNNPVLDENGVQKVREEVIKPTRLVFVNDNPEDNKDSRFLLYAVGKPFMKQPVEEAKPEKEAKPKKPSKKEQQFIDPGDMPPEE